MRGTRELRREGGKIITGIIPAYAGNTGGEGAGHGHASGSSPRMRGTHLVVREVVLMAGIIPAYAGNTSGMRLAHSHWRDHPRVCGEHKIKNATALAKGDHPRVCGEHPYRIIPIPEDMGSSPRMRGTLRHRRCRAGYRGIIPAYAGNTTLENS